MKPDFFCTRKRGLEIGVAGSTDQTRNRQVTGVSRHDLTTRQPIENTRRTFLEMSTLFWSRPLISQDMRDWVFDCFEWFDDVFEPPEGPILPTKAFFAAPNGNTVSTAKLVLEDIKRHMRFQEPTELAPLDLLPGEYRHTYQALSAVAGTHEKAGGISIIRYDPEQMNRPLAFINLLAHELMHARLAGYEDSIPGGVEAHELATDLGCIIAGFGVFQLQSADDVGWCGYMSQPTRAFALALFLDRRGLGIEAVSPFLSSRCRKLVQRGFKEL